MNRGTVVGELISQMDQVTFMKQTGSKRDDKSELNLKLTQEFQNLNSTMC